MKEEYLIRAKRDKAIDLKNRSTGITKEYFKGYADAMTYVPGECYETD